MSAQGTLKTVSRDSQKNWPGGFSRSENTIKLSKFTFEYRNPQSLNVFFVSRTHFTNKFGLRPNLDKSSRSRRPKLQPLLRATERTELTSKGSITRRSILMIFELFLIYALGQGTNFSRFKDLTSLGA